MSRYLNTLRQLTHTLVLSLICSLSLICNLAHAAGSQAAPNAHTPLPQAQPSSLAKRVSKYMSGHWQVAGTDATGNKIADGNIMVYSVAKNNFLAIAYRANQYSDLDHKTVKVKSRRAFMVMYFAKGNRFNLLSFQNSGNVKHYQGKLSKRGKQYIFTSNPINMAKLIRAQAVFTITPMGKDRYAENFYFNILAPGSDKVLKQKFVMKLIVTKQKHWSKKHSSKK